MHTCQDRSSLAYASFRRALPLGLALALSLATVACSGGYQGSVAGLQKAIRSGDTELALVEANAALGVDNKYQLPQTLGGDTPLLLLERAMILQAQGDHEAAVADLREADKLLEVLDFTEDGMGDVGKYLFSDDATLYKAPPHEKLLINTLGMLSYLALGDLESARVEARRLSVLQKYFKGAAPEEKALFGLGSYLAGFVFEKSGDFNEALLFYIEAYDNHGYVSAAAPIVYIGDAIGSGQDTYQKLKAELGEIEPPGDDEGEVLVVVQNGRAPYKVAERFPIGAFVVHPVANSRYRMSAEQKKEADRVMVKGLLKWINFPVLKKVGPRHKNVELIIDSESKGAPPITYDVEAMTIAAWKEDEPYLRIAAFTRMIARAIAGETTEAIAEGANLDRSLFPGASLLLGAAVEGGLTAADTPDTRTWTLLPARIQLYRHKVKPGTHKIQVIGTGKGASRYNATLDVAPRGQATAVFRFLR